MTVRTTKTLRVQIEGLGDLQGLRKLLGEDQYLKVIADVGVQIAHKIREQRNPTNGEFPVVAIYPVADDALRVEIEATSATHEFLEARLPQMGFQVHEVDEKRDQGKAEAMSTDNTQKPVAFLAHATEDKPLARRIAQELYARGIQTFFDEWEVRAGDSIRQKLDEGLASCTHFLVLLTPTSITKPWVKAEMDAGFVGMLGGRNRFLGLRHGVKPGELSPFLQTLLLLAIDDASFDADIERLVGDIYGVSRRPALAEPPAYYKAGVPDISPAASAVAKYFVETTKSGMEMDPQTNIAELQPALGLAEDDLVDAIDELKGMGCVRTLPVLGPRKNWPTGPHKRLFTRFDRHWKEWDPAADAIAIAQQVQAGERASAKIAETLGWPARRMNPALSYLLDRELVKASREISSQFVISSMHATDDTRRFLKALS